MFPQLRPVPEWMKRDPKEFSKRNENPYAKPAGWPHKYTYDVEGDAFDEDGNKIVD